MLLLLLFGPPGKILNSANILHTYTLLPSKREKKSDISLIILAKKKASENPTIAEALPYFSFRFIVLKSSAKFNRTRFGRSPKSNLANMTGTLGEVVKGEGPKSEAQAAILARNLIKNSRPCCGTNERLERYGASERPDQVVASSRADQPDLRPRADHVSLELV